MTIDDTAQGTVEFVVQTVVEEMIPVVKEVEKNDAVKKAEVVPMAATRKTVRWNEIQAVKRYEVTAEERGYKRSLKDYMKRNGPAPWVSTTCPQQSADVKVIMTSKVALHLILSLNPIVLTQRLYYRQNTLKDAFS